MYLTNIYNLKKIFNDKKIFYIIILLLTITIILLFYVYNKLEKYINTGSTNNKFKYIIRSDCNYLQSETLMDVLSEIKYNFNYNLYIPCLYEDNKAEYDKFENDENGVYFIIDNSDAMVGKEYLFQHVLKKYGKEKTLTLMPNSWVLIDDKDYDRFLNEFDSNNIYIMKKNIQRQNGIKISNNISDIIQSKKKDADENYPYVIIQELLQNPYTISGRKINLRVYVLVVRNKDKSNLYVYSDGFMYYTAELFKKNSLDNKVNITTGYIDRKVYEENPLTHSDLKTYLDSDREYTPIEQQLIGSNKNISEYVFNNIYNLITDIFSVFFDKIGNGKKLYNNIKFQLFGCDVAIDENLQANIMEINKGPDLGAKDKRDSELKHNLVKDIFKSVGLINNDDGNKFIQLV
jgi:hypothetical protein